MIEAPESPHHHHQRTGLPWFDLAVPIAVLCISVASLLTSLESEKSMHALVEQNTRLVSAQSTPLLMLDTANMDAAGKLDISMSLTNVGTGPARIVWFRVTDEGGVSYVGGDMYERLSKQNSNVNFMSQQISGTLMRVGEERSVFRWPKPDDRDSLLPQWNKLNTTRFALQASACYCSIFDECRITRFRDSRPVPVPSCESALNGHNTIPASDR